VVKKWLNRFFGSKLLTVNFGLMAGHWRLICIDKKEQRVIPLSGYDQYPFELGFVYEIAEQGNYYSIT